MAIPVQSALLRHNTHNGSAVLSACKGDGSKPSCPENPYRLSYKEFLAMEDTVTVASRCCMAAYGIVCTSADNAQTIRTSFKPAAFSSCSFSHLLLLVLILLHTNQFHPCAA